MLVAGRAILAQVLTCHQLIMTLIFSTPTHPVANVESNVFKSPGPMQFDTSGDVGPLSDRPYTLLADYLSVDELKQIIQPALQPPPLVMSTDPYNLGALEQQRLRYKPAIPNYLRGPVTSQEDELAPHSCDSFEELVKSFPLTTAGTSAIRLVPPVSSEGDEMVSTFSERSPTSTMMQTGMTETSKALTVGIVFASSQVPGFHPALAGLFDYLSGLSPPAKLIGFFCGYEGLIKDFWAPMTQEMVDQFRNLGGQDLAVLRHALPHGFTVSHHSPEHLHMLRWPAIR
eukprot:s228_g28.t1